MADERTPEQKTADVNLAAAIDACVVAYEFTEPGMINTDWIVIVAQQGWDDDGDSRTGIVTLYPDGDLPWHRILGLVRAADLRTQRLFGGGDE